MLLTLCNSSSLAAGHLATGVFPALSRLVLCSPSMQTRSAFHQHSSSMVLAQPSPASHISVLPVQHNAPAAAVEQEQDRDQTTTPGGQQQHANRELIRYSTHFPAGLYSHLAGLVAGRPFPTAVDMSCAAPGVAGAELGQRGFRVAVHACPSAPFCGLPPHTNSCACAAAAAAAVVYNTTNNTYPSSCASSSSSSSSSASSHFIHNFEPYNSSPPTMGSSPYYSQHHQQQWQHPSNHQRHNQHYTMMLTTSPHRLPRGCGDVVAVLPGPRDLLHLSCPSTAVLLGEARRLMAQGGYLALAWNDRDLSSPFVADLESLLEAVNPHYCRSSRQHNPPAVLAAIHRAAAGTCGSCGDAESAGVGGSGGDAAAASSSSSCSSSDGQRPTATAAAAAAAATAAAGAGEHIHPNNSNREHPHHQPCLELDSFSSWAHGLPMACAGVLQDLVGGFEVVRPYLAASSTHRKAFHQALRALVRRHFGDDESPFELPLITKLYVMRHTAAAAAAAAAAAQPAVPVSLAAASSTAVPAAAASTAVPAATSGGVDTTSASSCSSCSSSDDQTPQSPQQQQQQQEVCPACVCQPDDGCMTHHVRTRRVGLSSRDSCALRHLYA